SEVCATLALLREDFNTHVSRVDSEVAQLGRSVEGLGAALEQIREQAVQESNVEGGFVRRLFGSGAANANK
ncbi:MAG: type II secretion system ATPase ExeA, partial [uncultured bacterium]